jgi:hypothetical protein
MINPASGWLVGRKDEIARELGFSSGRQLQREIACGSMGAVVRQGAVFAVEYATLCTYERMNTLATAASKRANSPFTQTDRG